jgi:Spy/CpxP family protein refolding chaperone
LADRLELSETQRDQISAIMEAQRPAMEALRDEAAAARDAFHETYDIGDYDEAAFRAFFESQAGIHVEMKLLGAATVSQVWEILTPEQQEQILDLIELFRDGRGSGKRHGGGGRHGGN